LRHPLLKLPRREPPVRKEEKNRLPRGFFIKVRDGRFPSTTTRLGQRRLRKRKTESMVHEVERDKRGVIVTKREKFRSSGGKKKNPPGFREFKIKISESSFSRGEGKEVGLMKRILYDDLPLREEGEGDREKKNDQQNSSRAVN